MPPLAHRDPSRHLSISCDFFACQGNVLDGEDAARGASAAISDCVRAVPQCNGRRGGGGGGEGALLLRTIPLASCKRAEDTACCAPCLCVRSAGVRISHTARAQELTDEEEKQIEDSYYNLPRDQKCVQLCI